MFSEVFDVYLFVAGDAVSGAVACGGVECVASEEFFCVAGAQVDDFLVNVGPVCAEFCDVDFAGDFAAVYQPVFGAFAVFRAEGFQVAVILFDESEVEFFEDVGEVAAVEGGFEGVGGPRVDAGQDGREEGFGVKGCVGHGCQGFFAGHAVRHARDCSGVFRCS